MTDDVSKIDDLTDEHPVEELEGDEAGSAEPDFAPTAIATASSFDDDHEHDDDADPHSSFDPVKTEEEDPHLDIYGFGVPHGFGGEGEGDDEDEGEEVAEFDAF